MPKSSQKPSTKNTKPKVGKHLALKTSSLPTKSQPQGVPTESTVLDTGRSQSISQEVPAARDAKPMEKKVPQLKNSPGKRSALDAAILVLAESSTPMNTKTLIEAMAAKDLWVSPGGKTPAATLYSAIAREIKI